MNISDNLPDHGPPAGQDPSDVHEAVLNALPDRIAILDSRGWVTWVNRAWKKFAIRPNAPPYAAIDPGVNYLDVCREAAGGHGVAHDTLYGIYSVLEDFVELFSLEYSLETDSAQAWFLMEARPIRDGVGGLVLSHRDITPRKLAELEHDRLKTELQNTPASV